MTQPWRVVFMGTPEFAGPCLSALAESPDEAVLVVTQPDRPKGRGRKSAPPYIKSLALELGLPVWQPEGLHAPEAADRLRALAPHLLVVVAYGRILPRPILDIPGHGPVNLHPSLLPAYRGPAPINWAVLNGDPVTGVTTMLLDEGVDTGPTLLQRATPIGPDETAGELHDRLANMGAELLLRTIAELKQGLRPTPQPENGVSAARMLTKADGALDWTRSADELARQIRGLDPWPGAYTTYKNHNLKLFGARPGPGRGRPGEILAMEGDSLHVAAGDGSVMVRELQTAGKKRQTGAQFWHGRRLSPGDFLGT